MSVLIKSKRLDIYGYTHAYAGITIENYSKHPFFGVDRVFRVDVCLFFVTFSINLYKRRK